MNPRLSSLEKDSAAYRPLLSSWFAADYWLQGSLKPYLFQLENFLWFAALVVAIFGLFRLIPGVSNLPAAFAAMLFGLHPAAADTVNYASQRGVIMGAFGVVCGMILWIVWPWLLPQKLPIKLKRVPQHGFDAWLRRNYQILEARYLKAIHAPTGLYLWPVAPALLCDPQTAVFAPILAAYIVLFETRRTLRNAIPAAAICGAYWVFQLVFAWNSGESVRIPLLNYWFTEPWVAMRYLFRFFVPVHLSVETDLAPFEHFWDPLALAGYAGVAGLVALAVYTARRDEWRSVSFGIWWFLLALIPGAIVPHRVVEADWRMFIPFIGLMLAVAGAISVAVAHILRSPALAEGSGYRMPAAAATAVLAAAALGVTGWAAYNRGAVWQSEAALWEDAVAASPHSGRALMYYVRSHSDTLAVNVSLDSMRRAASLAPHDPVVEIGLAQALARADRKSDADREFRQAAADKPSYSPSYSSYSQWLVAESRIPEASEMAAKALALDPYDLAGRRAMMDVLSQGHQWTKLKQFAADTLRLLPNDPDGQRSLLVAQTGIDEVVKAETQAKTQPSVDHFLALSVLYYQTQRYEDCIRAAREALKQNPNQAEAYANIAAAYHALGKLDDTIAALREEVRLNPNLPSAQSNLALELEIKGKQER